jgi:putative transposase
MNKTRRYFSGPEKVAILKRRRLEKLPVSELCDELGIGPNLLYRWQKEYFDNGHAAFESDRKSKAVEDAKQREIEPLEAKLRRKNEVLSELMDGRIQLRKRARGTLSGCWIPHDTRDGIVDCVRAWAENRVRRRSFPALDQCRRQQVPRPEGARRQGQRAQHLRARRALADRRRERWDPRLTFMMLDGDVAACSPASVNRVLEAAGLLAGHTPPPTKKGTGFVQPLRPHEHWHIDVSYLNIAGTFCFLCSILDGCSRFIVHWEIRENREEIDVETIIQRGREAYPDARARIISDDGPPFIAKEFKEFICICGMTRVKASACYPKATARSNAGTGLSKATASACSRPCRWTTPAGLWPIASPTTTRSACTAPSATSRPRIGSPAANLRSSPLTIANSPRHASTANNNAKLPAIKPRQRRLHTLPSTSPPSAPWSRWRRSCNGSASRSATGALCNNFFTHDSISRVFQFRVNQDTLPTRSGCSSPRARSSLPPSPELACWSESLRQTAKHPDRRFFRSPSLRAGPRMR